MYCLRCSRVQAYRVHVSDGSHASRKRWLGLEVRASEGMRLARTPWTPGSSASSIERRWAPNLKASPPRRAYVRYMHTCTPHRSKRRRRVGIRAGGRWQVASHRIASHRSLHAASTVIHVASKRATWNRHSGHWSSETRVWKPAASMHQRDRCVGEQFWRAAEGFDCSSPRQLPASTDVHLP